MCPSSYYRASSYNLFRSAAAVHSYGARQQRRVLACRDPQLRHSPHSSPFPASFVTRGHLETAREGNTPSKLHFGYTVTTEPSSRKTALGGCGAVSSITWLGGVFGNARLHKLLHESGGKRFVGRKSNRAFSGIISGKLVLVCPDGGEHRDRRRNGSSQRRTDWRFITDGPICFAADKGKICNVVSFPGRIAAFYNRLRNIWWNCRRCCAPEWSSAMVTITYLAKDPLQLGEMHELNV